MIEFEFMTFIQWYLLLVSLFDDKKVELSQTHNKLHMVNNTFSTFIREHKLM